MRLTYAQLKNRQRSSTLLIDLLNHPLHVSIKFHRLK